MSTSVRIAIIAALAIAVGGVVAVKYRGQAVVGGDGHPTSRAAGGLPRLLDLGSTTCIPCKMMAPILEELKQEYAGRLQVDFIDVNVNDDAIREHGIDLIPTQIFFDAAGKELWRHEGFIAKEDILAKWKELGVALAPVAPAALPASAAATVPAAGRTGGR